MIDELVAKAQAAGYVLDAETVAVLREMEILLEIGKLAKSEEGRTYSIEEAEALTEGDLSLDEFLAMSEEDILALVDDDEDV